MESRKYLMKRVGAADKFDVFRVAEKKKGGAATYASEIPELQRSECSVGRNWKPVLF
jgi:hypothetical protein